MRPSGSIGSCLLVLLTSCSFDEGGLPSFGSDAGSHQATLDAAVVGCASNVDCAAPPDACHLAGSCGQDGVCHYPAVDCSGSDSACTVGRCDLPSGQCVAAPVDDGTVCGAPTTGEWSECVADQTCGSNGMRSRAITAQTCSAGACGAGDTTAETEACTIPAQNIYQSPCGPSSCGDYGECEAIPWSEQCSTSGESARQCSGMRCTIIGTCEPDTWSEATACTLDTDGDECWGCWSPGGGVPECSCAGGACVVD